MQSILDPYIDHNQCASIFNYAGIYMMLDVNSPLPNQSINQDDPSSSYDSAYLNRTFAILDAFREFPNTLGVSFNREALCGGASCLTY